MASYSSKATYSFKMFSQQQNQYIVESKIQFEQGNINPELTVGPLQGADAYFGILQFKASSCEISHKPHDIILTIDRSGSMCDLCSDYKSKMAHIIHVAINIVSFIKDNFRENPDRVRLSIYAFDDVVDTLLERESVTEDSFQDIVSKLKAVLPRAGTNIDLALKNIQQKVSQIKEADTTTTVSHIFMTDGITNMGNEENEQLVELVDIEIKNAFIGVGLDHDGLLLTSLGACKNACYYFIDKLEKAGLAYGEIIHSIFYNLLQNVRLTVENGLVYDYKNNVWADSLAVGDILGEAEKTYHLLKYSEADECKVTLHANLSSVGEVFQHCFHYSGSSPDDLTKYVFRQRTLQYLYQAKHVEDLRAFKHELSEFNKEMKQYMTENGLLADPFMKNLYDDIYICRKTVGMPYSLMYVTGRQTSQGTQQGYTVSQLPKERNRYDLLPGCMTPAQPLRRMPCMLARQSSIVPPTQSYNNISVDNPDTDTDSDEEDYEVSQTTNYLTPQATKLMREMSS